MTGKLTFYRTDIGFAENLSELRQSRLAARQFTQDYMVVVDGKAIDAKSAYVKGNGKTFEFDGYRYELERVSKVVYYIPEVK